MKLYIASSNKRKIADYHRRLSGIQIEHLELDFDEGRHIEIEDITRSKLNQAKLAFPGKKNIVVEDTGFLIPALNGFPGPYIKFFLSTIGVDRIVELMKSEEDKTAIFKTVLGFFDGDRDYFLTYNEVGHILTHKPQNTDLKGWTDLLKIYSHEPFSTKTLSEFTEKEYNDYHQLIEQEDCIAQLTQILKI